MKEKKDKNFILRLSKSDIELLEDLSNSFTKNGTNVSLSEAIRMSMLLARGYLKKSNCYRPIKRIKEINDENEQKQKLLNKLNMTEEELNETINFNWLED